jgi:hypothetical protein
MLRAIMLSVVILSVILLSVVVPLGAHSQSGVLLSAPLRLVKASDWDKIACSDKRTSLHQCNINY